MNASFNRSLGSVLGLMKPRFNISTNDWREAVAVGVLLPAIFVALPHAPRAIRGLWGVLVIAALAYSVASVLCARWRTSKTKWFFFSHYLRLTGIGIAISIAIAVILWALSHV